MNKPTCQHCKPPESPQPELIEGWEKELKLTIPHNTECIEKSKCECPKRLLEVESIGTVKEFLQKQAQKSREEAILECMKITDELQAIITENDAYDDGWVHGLKKAQGKMAMLIKSLKNENHEGTVAVK